jgi:predicted amidohydrolase
MRMKIAALQMVSTPDVARNLAAAAALIRSAALGGAKLVALPEYFCFMGQRDSDKLAIAETPGDGPIQRFLAEAARTHGVWLIGGTLPLVCSDPQRVLNSCHVFAPDGSLAARYDKIHLFRFEREKDGQRESYDEGRAILAGTRPTHVDVEGLRVGLSVCYDLRFPELYRRLSTPPCALLAVPAAFTYTTGEAHWELLLRARAVENQCYVIAPAQGGRHENGRRTWGHSMVIDPWGEVLAMQPEGEGVVAAELALSRLEEVRAQLPALQHRRLGH